MFKEVEKVRRKLEVLPSKKLQLVATVTGVSKRTLYYIISGKTPTIQVLEKLVKYHKEQR